jgi:uncharacterized protein (TIGR02646 family)
MRSITKSPAPTNVSPDTQGVRSLLQASAQLRADLNSADAAQDAKAARTAFDALEKEKLREPLKKDQRGLCVYCERRIGNDRDPVEHWRPLSRAPRDALHWENLYLSCATEGTCDDCKGDRELNLPWPTQLAFERSIGFTSDGRLYVRLDAPLTPEVRQALEAAIDDRVVDRRRQPAVFNLNQRTLCEARSAAIDAVRTRLERQFPNRTASKDERRALAQALLAQTERPEFVSIRVACLEKTFGDGRP